MEVYVVLDDRAREAALLKRRRSNKSVGGKADGGRSPSLAASRSPSLSGSRSPLQRTAIQTALGIVDSAAGATARRDGAMNTGQLDVALNPLFLNGPTSAPVPEGLNSALDAVRAYKAAVPPFDMWRVISQSFEDLYAQSGAQANELAATKVQLEKLGGDSGNKSLRSSRSKSTFEPVASGQGAADAAASPVNFVSVANPAQRAQMLSGYSRSSSQRR